MDEVNPLSYAAFLSGLISLLLTLYACGRSREVVAAPALAVAMAGVTLWSSSYGMELAAKTLDWKILWAQIAYPGIVLVPTAWLACVRRYSGSPPLTRGMLALLGIEPTAALLLVLTNGYHHLFWATTTVDTLAGQPSLNVTYAVGAWVNVAYSYGLIAASSILLLQKIARSPGLYRRQSAMLLLGAVAPWASHLVYLLGYHPLPGFDFTPFGFTATGIAMAYALFRLGLFRVMPVAQSAIVARIRDGIVVVNPAGVVVHVNPAAEELLAVQATLAVGRPATEAFAAIPALAARFVGDVGEGEVPIDTREEQRTYDVRVCALADSPELERGRLIVLRDVTAAKRAEFALLLARDEAVAAARSKADFLATMSHEIRTPMNGVIGTTEILLATDLNRDQRDLASTIRGSADSLLNIINGILDFSKIEAGRVELEEVDFDLRSLVENILDLFGPRARNQGLDLLSSFEDAVPGMVRGDSGRLRQILTNLVSNAIKFTSKGSVTVRCERMKRDDARAWLRLVVTDTGIGISREQQQRLFNPFVQADSSTTRQYGGTGLGLAISKRLVELMGGEIGLASQPGVGSRFDIVVPLEPVVQKSKGTAAGRPNLKGEGVLVLDTRAGTRRFLEGHLKSWGAAVETADAPTQAIAIMRGAARQRRPFGWLFVGPQVSGEVALRLFQTVRAESPLRHTRVVVMTEAGSGDDLEDLRHRGLIDASLLLPMHESRLRECIAALLSGRDETTASPAVRKIVSMSLPAQAQPRAAVERRAATTEKAPAARAATLGPRPLVPAGGPLPPAPTMENTPVAQSPRAARAPLAAAEAPPQASASVETASGATAPARILVVEDNEVNQRVAVRLLKNLGHAADVADDGAKGLEAVQAHRYDLIFMDCHMPEMDGYEATTEIRRRETAGNHVAIVAMTANAMEGDREQCLAAGMDDYLPKPVRASDLAAILTKWLPAEASDQSRVA